MSSGFTLQLRTNQCAVSCDRGVFWKSDKHQTHSLIIICIKRKHMSKIISICRTHNKFRTCSNFVLYVYVCVRFRAKFVRVLLNLHYILRCLVVVLNELNMWILYQKVVFFLPKMFFFCRNVGTKRPWCRFWRLTSGPNRTGTWARTCAVCPKQTACPTTAGVTASTESSHLAMRTVCTFLPACTVPSQSICPLWSSVTHLSPSGKYDQVF